MYRLRLFSGLALLAFGIGPAAAQHAAAPPSIEDRVRDLQKLDGYLPLYWDARGGTLLIEIPTLDAELLYVTALSAGLGSNDIGLDRGQLGSEHLVVFRRVGPKIFLEQQNQGFRAVSESADERRAVREAFARSVLWGFTVAAETDGRVLVDATDFLMRDVHGVTQRLKPATYRVERTRSAVNLERTKAFPKNSEIDVMLTFVSDGGNEAQAGGALPGGRVTDVAPSAHSVTLQQHHSFIELPGPGYTPLPFDPRAGYGAMEYRDYATPISEPLVKRFTSRHRLDKKDPSAPVSEAVKPIVYYVDRGTPEPIRTALLDGARWWNQAFEAAGYRNAFRVELMPEGADLLDVRYNVIQWVHRSTRGWSYGASVQDPRTGEIIKGHVTLGSLRVRQDYMIAEGLLSPYTSGTEARSDGALQMSLLRLRQLSAHEVGHTIGLGHNYYNSPAGWISVMDYPHPRAELKADGTIDLSQAYADRIGEWDKIAIRYGYGHWAAGTDAAAARRAVLDEGWTKQLRYLTNQDVEHTPHADQWALGHNMAEELNRVMAVRRAALARFGENVVRAGTPLALLEEALVPLFLHHRYQVEATASALGGLDFAYAMRGDGVTPVKPVPAADQKAALEALAATLKTRELVLPAALLGQLPPRPPGYGRHRELFPRFGGAPFDPIAPALVAADHVFTQLLDPQRAARLVTQRAYDATLPSLGDVIDRLVSAVSDVRPSTGYEAEVNRAVRRALADRLMQLAGGAPMPQVRAIATARLRVMQARPAAAGAADQAHTQLLAADIKRFLERPMEPVKPMTPPAAPPGAPIGMPDAGSLEPHERWCGMEPRRGSAFFPPLVP